MRESFRGCGTISHDGCGGVKAPALEALGLHPSSLPTASGFACPPKSFLSNAGADCRLYDVLCGMHRASQAEIIAALKGHLSLHWVTAGASE